jgi:hypothetical protein
MNTEEIAIRKGVANPETSQKLSLRIITNYEWYKSKKTSKFEAVTKLEKLLLPNEIEWEWEWQCIAPQMHEIAPLLPKWTMLGFDAIIVTKTEKSIECFRVEIENNHYAEAYAQMYLKLKEANLI